jgi:hypothetical protein
MITEDYVSFETAKLLKEKGFDEYCLKNYWSTDKELHNWGWELSYHRNSDGNRNTKDCVAPTLQMAMKWLREKHSLAITTYLAAEGNGWRSGVSRIKFSSKGFIVDIIDGIDGGNIPNGDTYEEACEAAIKYCLEKLI